MLGLDVVVLQEGFEYFVGFTGHKRQASMMHV